MNGARTVVEMIKKYENEVIFGVPGDATSIGLYEALYDVALAIRHIMARDERSASHMADAYARLSQRPGICECSSGAGPLYAIPNIAEANASSVPAILITSDIALSGEGRQTITDSTVNWTLSRVYLIKLFNRARFVTTATIAFINPCNLTRRRI